MNKILEYYSRGDIQKELLRVAKDREVAVKFGEAGFGRRPDILQYEQDIFELAKQGATSFHASEERWRDPLRLEPGMSKRQLDELRIGWDFFIDIDCKFLEYSKITAMILLEALRFHDVKNFNVKFSGGTGIHILIPFESFPDRVNDLDTKLLFPDGTRVIANYLKNLIKDRLSEKILEISTLEEISQRVKKPLSKEGKFDPFSVLEIDTQLISSRHMFRLPYSINEKTSLVSVPIDPNKIMDFNLSDAKIENVKVDVKFFNEVKEKDGSRLIMQAFDYDSKSIKQSEYIVKQEKKYELPKQAISEKYFPPCVLEILKGLKEDGRKRAIFILANFLRNTGYNMEQIKDILLDWNKKNYEPLREGYIISQLNWFKNQKQSILPPNCSNEDYYKSIGVCKPDNLCKMIKNPVNYTSRKTKFKNEK
ncbi:MAG: hypothetical protein NT139_00655 [Candidatus Woesearchaeota archaeon]|nr:hypothetical protein [Candidatus Woesearchaeota archaeon]